MKKKICIFLLSISFLMILGITVHAASNGNFTYSVNSDGVSVTVTGYTGTPNGDLIIPETIDGYTVTAIGSRAFYNCSGFTGTLTLPDSITSIGTYAFSGCTGFSGSLTIPNNVTSIGGWAFYNCSGFNGSLTLPDKLTYLGHQAFQSCSGFTGSLTIPDGVTSILYATFALCSGFNGSLNLPDNLAIIKQHAFSDCSGFSGSLNLPDSVTVIEGYAFRGCSGFTGSLILPNNITDIQYRAFENCSGFTGSLTFPDTLTSIESGTFQGCSGLTDVNVSGNIIYLSENAFSQCTSISQIRFCGNVPITLHNYINTFQNITATVYYPANNPTWTADVMKDYGGKLTWVAYGFPGAKIIASSSVPKNREFTADICFEYTQPATSFAFYNFSVDPEFAEIRSAEWLLEDAVIASVDLDNHAAAIAFDKAVDANKAVLRLNLIPSDVEQDTSVTIRCSAVMEVENESVSIPVESCSVTIRNSLYGDVNCDRQINRDDALYLLRFTILPERYPLSAAEAEFDFNKDGTLNADDAVYLITLFN